MTAFLDRQIEGDWPYLWVDATYVKARSTGRIVSMAVILGSSPRTAVGVNSDGRREVLGGACKRLRAAKPCGVAGGGMDIGPSEAETFWTAFHKLARRGLRGVKLVISDAHEGLKAAVARSLPSG